MTDLRRRADRPAHTHTLPLLCRALAFDFVTKGVLGEAAKKVQYQLLRTDQGKPNGVLGAWPSHAVTFVDNHDTGSTQQAWPHPRELVPQAYAYYLTHPGVPCVFWEHAFDWGEGVRAAVSELVALRRRNGIGRSSRVEILAAEPDMYVARVVGGGGGDGGKEEGGCSGGAAGEVVVKIGPRWDMGPLVPSQAEGFVMAASGRDYAVWEKRTGEAAASSTA
jgi:alpha-amylase